MSLGASSRLDLAGLTASKGHPYPLAQLAIIRVIISALAIISLSTIAAADVRQDCIHGSLDLRIRACTEILQSNPSDYSALANRGIGYRMTGQFDRAIIDLDQAMRLKPDEAGLYLERGVAYSGRGDQKSAIADLSQAISRNHSLIEAYFARAVAYEATGQRDLSTADLDEAKRLDRNMVAALYIQRGDALRTAGQYDKAVAAFGRAIDLNPIFPLVLAYCGRGASYDEKGNQEAAVADYQKCLEYKVQSDLVRSRQQLARERLQSITRR